MRSILIFTVFAFVSICVKAQQNWTPLDSSPMDMIYYPNDYPQLKIRKATTEHPVARIIYGRPQIRNRVVFGNLIEYGAIWRLGANEASEIEFFKDVSIAGKKVKKGRYTLYAIPYKDKWTIIINKELDVWGAFVYDAKKDILRTDVPTQKTTQHIENFTILFQPAANGATLNIAWEDVKVTLPIIF